jgi:hypothetical protein
MNFTAVDVGETNMFVAKMVNGVVVDEALTTIHITQDGRLFEYQEGQIVTQCWEWVNTYRTFWQGSSLIYLEPQISFHKGKERACLLIHTSLYSIFLTLFQMGVGPKPIIKTAIWWKREVGIQVGGHNTTGHSQDGATMNHDANKQRSIQHYETIYGKQVVQDLRLKFGKVDDAIDTRWMLEALRKNYLTLIGPLFYSGHIEAPGQTRIKAEDRMRPLPTLNQNPTFTPTELRRQYVEFVLRRKEAQKIRENNRLLKRIKR